MKRFLASLLLAFPVLALAQANFKKGYVITNTNDTLKGFINFKEQMKNPVSVDFRSALEGQTQVFTRKDCSGYSIDGEVSFKRFVVQISKSQIDVSSLSIGPDLSSIKDTVLLKVLQIGKNVSLFSYRDELKDRFYLLEKDNTEPQELIRQVYLKEDSKSIVVANKYAGQLLKPMKEFNSDRPIDENRLLRVAYDERSLLKVISGINQQELVKSKYRGNRFFVGVGFNLSDIVYSGRHDLASPAAKVKMSYSPVLTTGIDLFFNPAVGRLLFRTELSFLMSKANASVHTDEEFKSFLSHSFDRLNVVLTPQLIYNFYHTDVLKCFAGMGAGLNFSKTSNNKYTRVNSFNGVTTVLDDEVVPEQFNYFAQFMAGVVLHKKIEISAGYCPPMAISRYSYFNLLEQRVRFGLNYLFGK